MGFFSISKKKVIILSKINEEQRKKIENMTELLWIEVVKANSYFDLINLISNYKKDYSKEMNLSLAFYNVTYMGLIDACFSIVSRLYDKNGKNTIGNLLDYCKKNPILIVSIQNEIWKKEISVDYFESTLNKIEDDYETIKDKVDNLKSVRDKVISHNDFNSGANRVKYIEENPISYEDMKELIGFSSVFVQLIIAYITTVNRDVHANNITDLKNTLLVIQRNMTKE